MGAGAGAPIGGPVTKGHPVSCRDWTMATLAGAINPRSLDQATLFLLLPVVTAYPATTPRPNTTDSTQSIGVSTLFWMT